MFGHRDARRGALSPPFVLDVMLRLCPKGPARRPWKGASSAKRTVERKPNLFGGPNGYLTEDRPDELVQPASQGGYCQPPP
jgi:hypothetical protein